MKTKMLIPPPSKKAGRKRVLSAKAWIGRESAAAVFQSHVTLGRGIVHTLSTRTRIRGAALEFNRAHLVSHIQSQTKPQTSSVTTSQADLFELPAGTPETPVPIHRNSA